MWFYCPPLKAVKVNTRDFAFFILFPLHAKAARGCVFCFFFAYFSSKFSAFSYVVKADKLASLL